MHTRQSWPDPGLGFPDMAWTCREKVLNPLRCFLFGSGAWGEVFIGHDEAGAVRMRGEVAVRDCRCLSEYDTYKTIKARFWPWLSRSGLDFQGKGLKPFKMFPLQKWYLE